jgi:hypothetical protein
MYRTCTIRYHKKNFSLLPNRRTAERSVWSHTCGTHSKCRSLRYASEVTLWSTTYITTYRTWVTYLSSGKFSTDNNDVLLRAFLARCLTQHPARKESERERETRKKTSTAVKLHLKVVLVLCFYERVLLKSSSKLHCHCQHAHCLVSSVLQQRQYKRT